MWGKYKCKNCNVEMLYFTSALSGNMKCITFHGKVKGYCLGTLVQMESVSTHEVKQQHRKPYEHGKSNNTTN